MTTGDGRGGAVGLERADRDLVALAVLALLMAGPKHTYEMHRMMVRTRKDFVTGLPRSMYHAVERLEKAGHIVPVETVRRGRKPERTVFALTDRGRAVVQDRVERLLAVPDADSTLFTAALSFVACLPTDRAARALRSRCDALAAGIEQIGRDLADVPAHLPRVLLVETEYELAAAQAQLTWVRSLRRQIDDGTLSWPDDVSLLADGLGNEEGPPA